MRTHTTLTLRTLILHDMDVANGELNQHKIDTWLQVLPEITGEMFETIYFFTHSIFTHGLVGRQIRQIHKECITLLDKIDKYQNLAPEMAILKSSAIKCLDSVMDKIETDCSNYLENTVLMPVIHLRREQVGMESQTRLITAQLKNLSVPEKLQNLILECMTDLLKATRCFYFRMTYVKKLQQDLIDLLKEANKNRVEGELTDLLISKNYNSGNFIKYYQQKLMDGLGACITEDEQLKYLNDLERKFAQDSLRKSDLSYDNKRKRVKDLLAGFVNTELNIRIKKVALNKVVIVPVSPAVQSLNRSTTVLAGNYRIRTALSVDALAYLIKLMIAVKVIEPGVRTELMGFIAGIFQTPGTGMNGISPTSLETKYKQVVQSTAKTLRVILVRMLKLLDEEFGAG